MTKARKLFIAKLITDLKKIMRKSLKMFIDKGKNIPPFVDDFFKLEKMKIFDGREFQIMFCFFQWFTVYCNYQVNKCDL